MTSFFCTSEVPHLQRQKKKKQQKTSVAVTLAISLYMILGRMVVIKKEFTTIFSKCGVSIIYFVVVTWGMVTWTARKIECGKSTFLSSVFVCVCVCIFTSTHSSFTFIHMFKVILQLYACMLHKLLSAGYGCQ